MDAREIFNIVQEAIVEVSPLAKEILSTRSIEGKDALFMELGINSIDYAEIAYIVMSRLGVELPLDIFMRTNNINEVVGIFSNLLLSKPLR